MGEKPEDPGYPSSFGGEQSGTYPVGEFAWFRFNWDKYIKGELTGTQNFGWLTGTYEISKCPQMVNMFTTGHPFQTKGRQHYCGGESVLHTCRLVPDIIETSGDAFTT